MIKRILSSEEVVQRIKNFDKHDLSTIRVLSYGIESSSYSDMGRLLTYRLDTIFETLKDDSYTFIEMKGEQE